MRGRLKKPIQVFRQPFSDRDAIKALPRRVRHLFSGKNCSDNFVCPAGIGVCVRGRSEEVNCRLIAFCFFRTIKRYDNTVFVSYICFVFNGNITLGIECDKWEGGKFARFHAACVSDADNKSEKHIYFQ